MCVTHSKKEEGEREQSLCKTWEWGRQRGLGLTARKELLSRADGIEACGEGSQGDGHAEQLSRRLRCHLGFARGQGGAVVLSAVPHAAGPRGLPCKAGRAAQEYCGK